MALGNPAWKKGFAPNPKGRPVGAKGRLPSMVITSVLDVWEKLENEEKGLFDVAKENPYWFYEKFVSKLLPKHLDLSFSDTSDIDPNLLSDNALLEIIKNGFKQKNPASLKKAGKGRVVKMTVQEERAGVKELYKQKAAAEKKGGLKND